jgi:hypothetical protein
MGRNLNIWIWEGDTNSQTIVDTAGYSFNLSLFDFILFTISLSVDKKSCSKAENFLGVVYTPLYISY